MKFFYVATTSDGKTKKGSLEATSVNEATRSLLKQGLYVKKITTGRISALTFKKIAFGRVSAVDKLLFIKHLSTMIKSGISIAEALEAIQEQTTSQRFKKIISVINEKVKTGQALSLALSDYSKIFDPLFINIVQAGEESGTLQENLDYLANDLEERIDLRKKIRAAALYPTIVLVATFGLGLTLAYFVLPKIKRLFTTLEFELPLTTRILLKIAEVMDNYGNYIIVGVILGIVFLYFLLRQKFVKPFWHRLLIGLPIVGQVIINYNLASINRTFSILLKSGLTADQSLMITAETINNVVYQKKLKNSVNEIRKGKRIAAVLTKIRQSKRNPIFPLLVIKMIAVGEKSGRLQESLKYISGYYEKEVDDATKNLTVILEPILLIIVGLVVGFVAISVISPIYQITGKFGR